uniref:Uncharacterized protein n=1 Tax=Glossina austeni TaxID=7395 RepID=A0A1A9VXJ9_GLOAU
MMIKVMVAIPTFMRKRTSFHSHNICAKRLQRHIASFNGYERSVWSGEPLPRAMSTVNSSTPADNMDISDSNEEEDAEDAKMREERVAAYAAEKSRYPALIGRSYVLLDVKPSDDENDMAELE